MNLKKSNGQDRCCCLFGNTQRVNKKDAPKTRYAPETKLSVSVLADSVPFALLFFGIIFVFELLMV